MNGGIVKTSIGAAILIGTATLGLGARIVRGTKGLA